MTHSTLIWEEIDMNEKDNYCNQQKLYQVQWWCGLGKGNYISVLVAIKIIMEMRIMIMEQDFTVKITFSIKKIYSFTRDHRKIIKIKTI